MGIQILPNPNPKGKTYTTADNDYNAIDFKNDGMLIIGEKFTNRSEAILSNSEGAEFNISGDGRLENMGKILNNGGSIGIGSIINNNDGGQITNNGYFNNRGRFINNFGGSLVHNSDSDPMENDGLFYNNGEFQIAKGANVVNMSDYFTNEALGVITNDGNISTILFKFINNGTIQGVGTTSGNIINNGTITGGGNGASGGYLADGSLYHNYGSTKLIELGGSDDFLRDHVNTEHDFIDVTGDLIINEGTLEVLLIDGFKLESNQEFIISKVDGEVTGTYSGLVEGALVDKFDSIYGPGIQQNLYITYKAGDGNDIGLYTTNSSLAPSPSPDQEPVIPAPKPESIQTDDGFTQFTDADDVLTNQSDIKYRMMGGNDYIEVIGGNNYANGNMGKDTIILRGGKGEYLGGKDSDTIEVFIAEDGTSVNGNRGEDTITGSVSGVTYRGGKDNDLIAVSQGEAWGDLGADVFRGVTGEGYAVIQDYAIGEDVVELAMDGEWSNVESGLMFSDDSGDQIMLLLGINNVEQVTRV